MTGTREVLKMGSMQILSGMVELRIMAIRFPHGRIFTLKDRTTLIRTLREKVGLLLESTAEPQQTR
jgi:hypothetical protein